MQPCERAKDWRKRRVKDGRCGWCGQKRNQFKWLCDGCARKHREKQQAQQQAKKDLAEDGFEPPPPTRTKKATHLLAWLKKKRGLK